jgi:peptide/nickel transport system permease protein
LNVQENQFVITAKSKGLSNKMVLKKHVLVNAIFPFISLLGGIIPSLFAGSVVIEVLFNVPGMGRLAYQSILSHDWPVLFGIVLLSGIITIISQILVDILYHYFDPRIKFSG